MTFRQCRNLSEKKRRNSFNVLLGEILNLINPHSTKMDKASILRNTIDLLKNLQSNTSIKSDIDSSWKPPSVTNEEFLKLTLESQDGFAIFFTESGHIIHLSEEAATCLNYTHSSLMKENLFDLIYPSEVPQFRIWMTDRLSYLYRMNESSEKVIFNCNIRCRASLASSEIVYRHISLYGISKPMNETVSKLLDNNSGHDRFWLACVACLVEPLLDREIILTSKSQQMQFLTKHNFEWNFIHSDNNACGIIGYLPFELLGVSAFQFYHIDDLDNIYDFLNNLKNKGEASSNPYRFLLKNLDWLWLQTRAFITYNQWTSKPECVTAINYTLSYEHMETHTAPCYTYEQEFLSLDNNSCMQSTSSTIAPNSADLSIREKVISASESVFETEDPPCTMAVAPIMEEDQLFFMNQDEPGCKPLVDSSIHEEGMKTFSDGLNLTQSKLLTQLKSKYSQLQSAVGHQFDQLSKISQLLKLAAHDSRQNGETSPRSDIIHNPESDYIATLLDSN